MARVTLTILPGMSTPSIPQRYVHAQSELEAVKQVWAKRSELPLSEVCPGLSVACQRFSACSTPVLCCL